MNAVISFPCIPASSEFPAIMMLDSSASIAGNFFMPSWNGFILAVKLSESLWI